MTVACRPRLIICTTCRDGRTPAPDEPPAGALMLEAVRSQLDSEAPAPVDLQGAVCLANCDHGCSAAIAMPGKWTYLLGHLRPAMTADLLAYAASYAASTNGAVLPSRRPASLRHMVIGRVPHLEPFA